MKKYSNDNVVLFNEQNHIYTNIQTGKQLTSVTTFINQQVLHPFDSDKYSKSTGLKLGLTPDEVLNMWRGKALNSTDMGTYCHAMPENYFLGNPYNPIKNYPKSYIMLSWIRQYFDSGRLKPIASELIVYNEHLAGQIDCIAENKNGDKFILDFKTNETIDDNNYNKFLKLLDIPDSTFHKYSLQLSIYKVMSNMDIKDLYLIHIDHKEHNLIEAIDYSEQLKTLEQFKYR